jgi:hypothetical protein
MDLIQKLLISDAKKRISWNNFFDHPFVKLDENIYKDIYNDVMVALK